MKTNANEQFRAVLSGLGNSEILTAAKGYGSFVTLDVGRSVEPKPLLVWIYCCRWQLRRDGREVLECESPNDAFDSVLGELVGLELEAIELKSNQHVEIQIGGYQFELYADSDFYGDDAELLIVLPPRGPSLSVTPALGLTLEHA